MQPNKNAVTRSLSAVAVRGSKSGNSNVSSLLDHGVDRVHGCVVWYMQSGISGR